ncbi:hypothetical protein BD309DRAFT_888888 [Dichomitus squalens]|uniref:F-box domain-containing protein n=1 Tax=Dichomitus squalens TaxID=114155 RepID=A0A4Q9MUC0_9APHY|nr:hypothetical protein BD311DRAFT_690156 [Dichomitus squalens]TBU46320.1 hypothetical protein BD309DRAFT_888888 [Dichomitus squalens]TBU56230.1 hypothetical protein BD310DRAFT_855389 [Dichomitus squalens]
MSLLQDVLRTQTLESLEKTITSGRTSPDDDDELVNVMSLPGSPGMSRPGSRPASRPHSPTRGSRPSPLQPLSGLKSGPSRDPLRVLPTDVSQRVFSHLSIRDLARCSRVSKKWNKSQTLNYVWFQHYRKENFHDESLPPGKWTKRESKQNWRTTYLTTIPNRSPPQSPRSGYLTPLRSGQQTPREIREEKWKQEVEGAARPSKVEMREMYKELGGRKARGKGKLGGTAGMRDRGGWGEVSIEDL